MGHESVAVRIARRIREDLIDTSDAQSGRQLPTVRALQQRYDTSVTTVTQALALLESQGCIVRKYGVGCFIRDHAVVETHRPVTLLGLVLPTPTEASEIPTRVYQGVLAAARGRGCGLMMACSGLDYAQERAEVERLIAQGCAALIVYPVPRAREESKRDYLNREHLNVPVVLMDTSCPEQRRSQVVFDQFALGREMTEFLVKRGRRRIAFMAFAPDDCGRMAVPTEDRYRGYVAALRSAGLEHRPEDVWHLPAERVDRYDAFVPPLTEILEAWRGSHNRADAIIALHDVFATLTIAVAQRLGVRIPEELAVTGFDNLALVTATLTRFPSTDPDWARACEKAVDAALQTLRGDLRHNTIFTLPVPLVHTETVPHHPAS